MYISPNAIINTTIAPPSSVLQLQPPCHYHNLSHSSIIDAVAAPPAIISRPYIQSSVPQQHPRHHQHFSRPSVIDTAAASLSSLA